jgi:hypothetical protein
VRVFVCWCAGVRVWQGSQYDLLNVDFAVVVPQLIASISAPLSPLATWRRHRSAAPPCADLPRSRNDAAAPTPTPHCPAAVCPPRFADRAEALAAAEAVGTRTDVLNLLVRLLGSRRYLEIGIDNARNLAAVAAPERLGVDPGGGAAAAAAAAGERLFPGTSDDFFARFAEGSADGIGGREGGGGGEGFDLVFVDGDHSARQVRRATLPLAARRCAWCCLEEATLDNRDMNLTGIEAGIECQA